MAQQEDNGPPKLGPFIKGQNNISKESELSHDELRVATNVDIHNSGSLTRRKGYELVYSGNNIHSLYKQYFVEGTSLKHINPNTPYDITDLGITVTGNELSYTEINSGIIYADSNGVYSVNGTKLGLINPTKALTIRTDISGSLSIGTYLFSYCYIDTTTGEISGMSNVVEIPITKQSSGIQIDDIGLSGPYSIMLYLSTANSSDLYHVNTITAVNSTTIRNVVKNTKLSQTLNLKALPGGQIVRAYKGRLYVAQDNVLWYSKAFRYGLHNPANGFFYFSERITIVQHTSDGIYVVADKVYFLKGDTPEDMQLLTVRNLTAVEGTGITAHSSSFSKEFTVNADIAYWFGETGGILGLPSGELIEYNKSNTAPPVNLTKGTTDLVQNNSISKIVTSIQQNGGGAVSSLGATDRATAKILRNGVFI